MALITCSECGRAVSNKANVCIGCGAPLTLSSGVDGVPKRSKAPRPTRAQIKRSALSSLAMLVFGVVWAGILDSRSGANRLASFGAAMLIIGGLCWFLVTLIHAIVSRP